jgi:hypothetical protein
VQGTTFLHGYTSAFGIFRPPRVTLPRVVVGTVPRKRLPKLCIAGRLDNRPGYT